MVEQNSIFQKRIIAFIDILGFKNKVEEAVNSTEKANKILNALKRIFKTKNENTGKNFMNMKDYGYEISTFSDSIVMSFPAENDNLFFLIIQLIHLQLDLALEDVLIRGGLTIGDLYHDGDIVFGPAMNMAYKLESKVAIYPRIIVDIKAIKQYVQCYKNDEDAICDLSSLLRIDRDGLYYIDMLGQYQELSVDGTEYYEWLSKLREIIIEGLNEKDIFVKVKYQWLQTYFNSIVTNDKTFLPVPESALEDDSNKFRNLYSQLRID